MRPVNELIDDLRKRRVIIGPDHFVLGDGYGNPDMHASLFVVGRRLYKATDLWGECILRIADRIGDREFDMIVTPDEQSIPSARILAKALAADSGTSCIPVYSMSNARHLPEKSGRVLIHDDVVNRGRQILQVLQWMDEERHNPIGISCLFTRTEEPELHGLPLFCAVDRVLTSVHPNDCPLCRERKPINTLFGKGALYCVEQGDVPPKAHGM